MLEGNAVQNYYEGACVYRGDGSLDYILHPEGVVRATGQGLSHEYFLNDHLGNTRVVFDSNGEVLQATDYYAFGMEHTPKAKENENRYLYNGKELQDETFAGGVRLGWYDYGARFYDPQIARFHSLDILADTFSYQTPYAYAVNNPIKFIDVLGMGPGDLFATKRAAAIDWGKTYNGASIIKQKELGSTIYEVKNGNTTTYSYNEPSNGKAHSCSPNKNIPNGTKASGVIHSHGNDDVGYNDNNFSGISKTGSNKTSTSGDIGYSNKKNLTGYVTTPNGSAQEYEPSTGTITTISTQMPSDSKDPTRLNKIEPLPTAPLYNIPNNFGK